MPSAPLRSFFILLFLGAALLTLALVVRSGLLARRNPGQPMSAEMRESMQPASRRLTATEELTVAKDFPGAVATPSGLRYTVQTPGSGPVPHPGQTLTVNYAGRLLDGTPFDSTAKHGRPFTFNVGAGLVISGWDEAFATMTKGEKRTLIVPWWLAYGEDGRPPIIPPRATLVFDVELLDIR